MLVWSKDLKLYFCDWGKKEYKLDMTLALDANFQLLNPSLQDGEIK